MTEPRAGTVVVVVVVVEDEDEDNEEAKEQEGKQRLRDYLRETHTEPPSSTGRPQRKPLPPTPPT